MLYVLAYPEFEPDRLAAISGFRERFEPARAKLVGPHITLVFAARGIEDHALVEHTRQVASAIRRFQVTFSHAEAAFDGVDENHKLFLMVSTGGPTITAMYRKLYDGPLANERRDDIPFVPHMTIATSDNKASIENALARSVQLSLPIEARIGALAVVKLVGSRLDAIALVPLSG